MAGRGVKKGCIIGATDNNKLTHFHTGRYKQLSNSSVR
jgi:sugar diacid utilization regulator